MPRCHCTCPSETINACLKLNRGFLITIQLLRAQAHRCGDSLDAGVARGAETLARLVVAGGAVEALARQLAAFAVVVGLARFLAAPALVAVGADARPCDGVAQGAVPALAAVAAVGAPVVTLAAWGHGSTRPRTPGSGTPPPSAAQKHASNTFTLIDWPCRNTSSLRFGKLKLKMLSGGNCIPAEM